MEHGTWNKITTIMLTISIVLCSMFYVPFVSAQQISLSLSPPLITTVIKPGKSLVIAYNLVNNSDPAVLKTQILPFEAKDNLGHIAIKPKLEGPIRFDLDNSDLKLGQPFLLRSNQSQQLTLHIKVPENTPLGDYYYTLLAETQTPPTLEGVASSKAKATIGSNIIITVTNTGETEVKSKFAIFDVLPHYNFNLFGHSLKLFDSNDPIPVIGIIENDGINVIKPQGKIILKGNLGEKAEYQIIPQNVLEESQRLITATPSAQINCEKNRKLCSTQLYPSLVLSGFFIGKYSLSAQLNFGENTPQIFATTYFVALPFKFLIGLAVSLLIGLFIIWKIRNKDEEIINEQ